MFRKMQLYCTWLLWSSLLKCVAGRYFKVLVFFSVYSHRLHIYAPENEFSHSAGSFMPETPVVQSEITCGYHLIWFLILLWLAEAAHFGQTHIIMTNTLGSNKLKPIICVYRTAAPINANIKTNASVWKLGITKLEIGFIYTTSIVYFRWNMDLSHI